jgi:hypothetical protein
MARLPSVGGDSNQWGDILNDFLLVAHNSDGTIQDGIIGNNQVISGANIAQSKIANLTTDLANKEPSIASGTTAQYYRGDKTWATLDKSTVGLASVDNTADNNKPVSTAQAAADSLRLLKAGDTMTGSLNLANTATGGVMLYNTADQATNYERLRTFWTGNTGTIFTESGGTGLVRNLSIGQFGNTLTLGSNASAFQFARTNTGISNLLNITSTGLISATGIQTATTITPVINQSGTAGYTMLHINPTETAVGSGTKRLIEAQVGGVTQFAVGSTGSVLTAGDLIVNGTRLVTATNGTNIAVGIGTNNPTSATANRTTLHMADTTGNGLEIRMNSTSVQARQFNNNSEFGFGTDTNHTVRFFVNGGANTVIALDPSKQSTFFGKINAVASDSIQASLKITAGTDPAAPVNGDIWFDGTNLKMRVGGVTRTFTLV